MPQATCLLNKQQETCVAAMFVTGSNLKLKFATSIPRMRERNDLVQHPLPLPHLRGSSDKCMGEDQHNLEAD
jgi:hypothetical protein